jgi:hypothetical protein
VLEQALTLPELSVEVAVKLVVESSATETSRPGLANVAASPEAATEPEQSFVA